MDIYTKGLAVLPPRSLKAIFQGDGLEIVRLHLRVGGWELPSGRNAKGCLEAVKATAGECLTERERGFFRTHITSSTAVSARVNADAVSCGPRIRTMQLIPHLSASHRYVMLLLWLVRYWLELKAFPNSLWLIQCPR